MKKKMLTILSVGAILTQSSGISAMQSTKKAVESVQKVVVAQRESALMRGIRSPGAMRKWMQSPEFKEKAQYNYEVVRPKIIKKYNLSQWSSTIPTILVGPLDYLVMLTGADMPELTPQLMQAAKEAVKYSVWPELAQKVVAHFVARMEGNKEKIAQAYKEANNLFFEMEGLTQHIQK